MRRAVLIVGSLVVLYGGLIGIAFLVPHLSDRVVLPLVMGLVLVLGVAYSVKAGEADRLKKKRKAKR